MKSAPAPDVPGNSPWERLDNAVRSIFKVSKEALLKEQEHLKKKKKRQRASKRKDDK